MNRDSTHIERHQLFRRKLEDDFYDLGIFISKSLVLLEESEQERRDKEVFQNRSITPFMIKHSLFISAYAFMEYSLKEFCEIIVSQQKKHERRVSNFEKVHQYYSFLTNEIQLDRRKTEKDWAKLEVFRDLRNSIIHYNSTLGKNISTKTYIFIKEDPRMEFEEPRGFKIKDKALMADLIETSKFFLFAIIDEYNLKYFEDK